MALKCTSKVQEVLEFGGCHRCLSRKRNKDRLLAQLVKYVAPCVLCKTEISLPKGDVTKNEENPLCEECMSVAVEVRSKRYKRPIVIDDDFMDDVEIMEIADAIEKSMAQPGTARPQSTPPSASPGPSTPTATPSTTRAGPSGASIPEVDMQDLPLVAPDAKGKGPAKVPRKKAKPTQPPVVEVSVVQGDKVNRVYHRLRDVAITE